MISFCGFNLCSVPGFTFLSFVVVLNFSVALFPAIIRDLDFFSGAYLNKVSVSVVFSD